ncbi:hypothetical protein Tco_0078809 [Tanacetum coccineum]
MALDTIAKALRIGDSNKRKWEGKTRTREQPSPAAKNERQEDKKLLRFMLQPQLRVEATLGTYHGAIGARHIISRVRVLLGVVNVTSLVTRKGIVELGFLLELPQELSKVQHTFHVSNLKKCHVDEPLVVPLDGLYIDDKLYFIEENIEIRSQKVAAKLYPKLSRFVVTLGKELSIPGNMKTNSGRNIRIFSLDPYRRQVS